MVLGNAWGITIDSSGLYWPRVVLHSKVIHEVLLWTVVVSTGWSKVVLQALLMPEVLLWTVVIPTANSDKVLSVKDHHSFK